MTAESIKRIIQELMNTDYKNFVTALTSIELSQPTNSPALNEITEQYMDNDNWTLLNDNFFTAAEEKNLILRREQWTSSQTKKKCVTSSK